MRVVLAALALACILWSVTSALEGQWGTAFGAGFGAFLAASWFIALSVAAAAKAGDEGFGRDEGDER